MKFLMTKKFSSQRSNNGIRNREEEINSVARTNLISPGSFSFDYEDSEWNAKALNTGNELRCKEEVVRKLQPQNSESYTRSAEQDQIPEEEEKEKQWSSRKKVMKAEVRMSRLEWFYISKNYALKKKKSCFLIEDEPKQQISTNTERKQNIKHPVKNREDRTGFKPKNLVFLEKPSFDQYPYN